MNPHTHNTLRQPPDCGRFASLLPLLDDAEIDAAEAAAAREHLRGCPRCQARQAQYATLDTALRARYGPASVAPHPTEEIMRYIRERTEDEPTHETSAPPAARRSRAVGLLRGLGAAACIAALIAVTFALFSTRVHIGPGGKTYTGTPTYTFKGITGSITSISMVSPTEGWALAQTIKTPQGTRPANEVTFYHYLNGAWTPIYVSTSVPFGTSGINGNGGPGGFNGTISMDSPTDGWADVHNFNRVTILLHYTGGSWHEVPVPSGDVYGVRALSPRSVWAFSALGNPGGTVIHYDGTSWVPQAIPYGSASSASVLDFSMASDSHGWALVDLGSAGGSSQDYAIVRYDGSAWTTESTFSPGEQASLSAFSMASDEDGWVLGERVVADASGSTAHVPLKELLYHYVNGHWNAVSLPIQSGTFTTLLNVTTLSPTDTWIQGVVESAYPGATVADYQAHTVLFHYTNGAWTQVPVPDANAPVATVAQLAFAADGSGWAGGFSADIPASQTVQTDDIPNTASPMLWTYRNGQWSVYQQ